MSTGLLGRLKNAGSEAFSGLLGLLYPPHCPLCRAPLERPRFVCDGCLSRITLLGPPWCAICGEPLEDGELCGRCAHERLPFERARSAAFYEGHLARLIQLFKFEGERALASELARLMLPQLDEFKGIEAITFVPLHPRSERARGFNQAELLARRLGELAGIPALATLRKLRETRPQVGLTGPERIKNVEGAFDPLGSPKCEKILLIDDVYTTGSTVRECSRTLKEAGYEWVGVLTLARTPRPPHHIATGEMETEDAG